MAWRNLGQNHTGLNHHWLQINLKGKSGNRQGVGAVVTVSTTSAKQSKEVGSSEGSFFTQGHYRLNFGLGQDAQIKEIVIRWADGSVQTLSDVPADQLLTIVQTETTLTDDRSD